MVPLPPAGHSRRAQEHSAHNPVERHDAVQTYTLSNDALRDLISTNAESLRLLRLGLTRQCSLPADAAMTNTAGMMNDLANMKRLVLLLIAQGRLHELDNQPVEAAHIYLDAIHFGNEISRGGFMITHLVGIACEAIGRAPLSRLVPKLTPAEARRIIAELEKMDNTRITWDEVSRNENKYFYHALRQCPNPMLWAQSGPDLVDNGGRPGRTADSRPGDVFYNAP